MIFDEGELGEVYEAEGDLAQLLKKVEFVPPMKTEQVQEQEQQNIERIDEFGQKKKKIIPKIIEKL